MHSSKKKSCRMRATCLAAAELGEEFRDGVGATGSTHSVLCTLGFICGGGFCVIIAYADEFLMAIRSSSWCWNTVSVLTIAVFGGSKP